MAAPLTLRIFLLSLFVGVDLPPMATMQATKNTITLKGSTEIVTEFFGYSINSILYQVVSVLVARSVQSRGARASGKGSHTEASSCGWS